MAQQHIFEGALRWTGTAQHVEDKLRLERSFVVEFPGKALPPVCGLWHVLIGRMS